MTEYLSLSQFAALHGKDPGFTRKLAIAGRIPAIKIGNQWAIPASAEYPTDQRVKSGKYKNWRKPKTASD